MRTSNSDGDSDAEDCVLDLETAAEATREARSSFAVLANNPNTNLRIFARGSDESDAGSKYSDSLTRAPKPARPHISGCSSPRPRSVLGLRHPSSTRQLDHVVRIPVPHAGQLPLRGAHLSKRGHLPPSRLALRVLLQPRQIHWLPHLRCLQQEHTRAVAAT